MNKGRYKGREKEIKTGRQERRVKERKKGR